MGGGGSFSDGGASFLSGGGAPRGEGGGGGHAPHTMENPCPPHYGKPYLSHWVESEFVMGWYILHG